MVFGGRLRGCDDGAELPALAAGSQAGPPFLFTAAPAMEAGKPLVPCDRPPLMLKCPIPGKPGPPQDRLDPL